MSSSSKFSCYFFLFTLTQSVRLPLVTYPSLCSPCVTYRILCRAIGHQKLPTQPFPRDAEDFPRGGNHSKHMSLLTHLAWLQPICYNSKLIFIRVNAAKHKAPATLISSHKLNTKIIAPSKNAFQNIGTHQNSSLKKCIWKHRRTSKMQIKKIHFKTSVIKKIFTNKNNFFYKIC